MSMTKIKTLILLTSILIACYLTSFINSTFQTEYIIVNSYFIPIMLSVIWFRKKSFFVLVFLLAYFIYSHNLFIGGIIHWQNASRFSLLIVVTFVMYTAMGKIERTTTDLKSSEDNLNIKMADEHRILTNISDSFSDVEIGVSLIDSKHNIKYCLGFLKDKYLKAVGKKCFQTYLGLESPCEMCPLNEDQQNRSVFITHDEEDRIYSISSLLDTSSRKQSVLCVFQDITAKVKLQEQLLHSQKMDALGRFVSSIVHDFNNLLTPIMTLSDLGILDISDEKKLRDYFKDIKAAALNGRELTSQLLSFSRKQIMNPITLDLNETIISMKKMLKLIIGDNVELQYSLSEKAAVIEIDPEKLRQVLVNLVSNAKDAMPKGGKLLFETSNIGKDEINSEEHPELTAREYIFLSIKDSGKGMDKDILNKIFEPFFSTKGTLGTGLGLATVYGIIKQSSGHIFVNSEPGKGSAFNIYLPQCDKETIPVEEDHQVAKILNGSETVLVIEDEELLRDSTVRILTKFGYNVLEASSGENGVALCQEYKEQVDLLVSDIMLPGALNGKTALVEIQKIFPDIKVIFMSGYTENIIVHEGILDKDIVFLQKPFEINNFLETIRRVLNDQ